MVVAFICPLLGCVYVQVRKRSNGSAAEKQEKTAAVTGYIEKG